MSKKKCKNCYFYEQCAQKKACEDFTPINDEREIKELINKGRVEYRIEWNRYIDENQD